MQRAKPFAFQGVNPQPPQKSVIVKRSLYSLYCRGGGLTHNHAPYDIASGYSRGVWVAQRSRLPQGAACGQPPSQREGGSVWQIFTLEQLKSHSWNIAKVHRPPSVGRSLIGTGLQDNAPAVLVTSYRPASTPPRPPKSSYASKGICPIYRYTNNLNYSYGCYLC